MFVIVLFVWEEIDVELGEFDNDNGGEISGGFYECFELEDFDFVKFVFFKGIFSVLIILIKLLVEIRVDIKRVLRVFGVDYKEIKGGFRCVYSFSIVEC